MTTKKRNEISPHQRCAGIEITWKFPDARVFDQDMIDGENIILFEKDDTLVVRHLIVVLFAIEAIQQDSFRKRAATVLRDHLVKTRVINEDVFIRMEECTIRPLFVYTIRGDNLRDYSVVRVTACYDDVVEFCRIWSITNWTSSRKNCIGPRKTIGMMFEKNRQRPNLKNLADC